MTKTASGIHKDIIAAVDIGSRKVVCTVAYLDAEKKHMRLLGVGHHVSRGVHKGEVVDLEALEASVLQAIHAAEQSAGEHIKRVVVNVSGRHLLSERVCVESELGGRPVDYTHLQDLFSHESLVLQDKSYQIIHTIPQHYSLDKQTRIVDPRGMFGQTLGAVLNVVTASSNHIRNIATVLRRCHVDCMGIYAAGMASGEAVLSGDEKQFGVCVIDLGAEVTDVAIYHEGKCVHLFSMPLGSAHITNDIAKVFSISLQDAERLKTLYGNAIATTTDREEMITLNVIGDDPRYRKEATITKADLIQVIQSRVEEIFSLIAAQIKRKKLGDFADRRFVLTGGGSALPGIRELASRLLNNQVRIGRPIHVIGGSDNSMGPPFATCAGLLSMAHQRASQSKVEKKGLIKTIGAWIKANF